MQASAARPDWTPSDVVTSSQPFVARRRSSPALAARSNHGSFPRTVPVEIWPASACRLKIAVSGVQWVRPVGAAHSASLAQEESQDDVVRPGTRCVSRTIAGQRCCPGCSIRNGIGALLAGWSRSRQAIRSVHREVPRWQPGSDGCGRTATIAGSREHWRAPKPPDRFAIARAAGDLGPAPPASHVDGGRCRGRDAETRPS